MRPYLISNGKYINTVALLDNFTSSQPDTCRTQRSLVLAFASLRLGNSVSLRLGNAQKLIIAWPILRRMPKPTCSLMAPRMLLLSRLPVLEFAEAQVLDSARTAGTFHVLDKHPTPTQGLTQFPALVCQFVKSTRTASPHWITQQRPRAFRGSTARPTAI